MKKVFLSLAIIATISLTGSGQASPAQPQIDTSATLAGIDALEAAYYASNGRYWQGLDTHTIPPGSDTPDMPNNVMSAPTDQPESWLIALPFISLVDQVGYSTRVDVYNGPGGWGYVVTFSTIMDGVLYVQSVNRGPDAYKDTGGWVPTGEVDITGQPLLFVSPLEQ